MVRNERSFANGIVFDHLEKKLLHALALSRDFVGFGFDCCSNHHSFFLFQKV